jgi:hypothetical protein
VSYYKNKLGEKFGHEKIPKMWLQRMCGFLRTDFLKFYPSISGITGHPVKIKINGPLIYLVAVGCKNPSVNILFRSQMAAEKQPWLPKKKLPYLVLGMLF